MANYCKTKYVITGSNEDISNLNSIFQRLLKEEVNKSSNVDNTWLGHIVNELDENPDNISCRRWFESVKLKNSSTLSLTTWSAWSPCYELFELIVKKFPTLQYYFISSEPGLAVYITNDADKKYFRYGKKYDVIDKETIKQLISMVKNYKNEVRDENNVVRVVQR